MLVLRVNSEGCNERQASVVREFHSKIQTTCHTMAKFKVLQCKKFHGKCRQRQKTEQVLDCDETEDKC